MKMYLIAVCLLLSACAFKQDKGTVNSSTLGAPTSFPSMNLSMNWPETATSAGGAYSGTKRELTHVGGDVFRASYPITLPMTVPTDLTLDIEIPDKGEDVRVVRGFLKSRKKKFEIRADVKEVNSAAPGKKLVGLSLTGLNALYPEGQSVVGDLSLEFFGGSQKLTSVEMVLRTPPSELKVDQISIRDWKTRADGVDLAIINPVIGEKRLNLIRVVEIQNQDRTPVEVTVPRRTGASFSQWCRHLSHRDTGCSAVIDTSEYWAPLSDEVLMFPIRDDLLVNAEETLKDPDLKTSFHLKIRADENIKIAVYAIGGGANAWMDSGPARTETRTITVATDCYKECSNYDCPGEVRDPPGRHGLDAVILSPGCRCYAWDHKRHSGQLTVGTEKGAVNLVMPQQWTHWPVRYSDLDQSQDYQIRFIKFLDERSNVDWF